MFGLTPKSIHIIRMHIYVTIALTQHIPEACPTHTYAYHENRSLIQSLALMLLKFIACLRIYFAHIGHFNTCMCSSVRTCRSMYSIQNTATVHVRRCINMYMYFFM